MTPARINLLYLVRGQTALDNTGTDHSGGISGRVVFWPGISHVPIESGSGEQGNNFQE
jgi:hypothetical protein